MFFSCKISLDLNCSGQELFRLGIDMLDKGRHVHIRPIRVFHLTSTLSCFPASSVETPCCLSACARENSEAPAIGRRCTSLRFAFLKLISKTGDSRYAGNFHSSCSRTEPVTGESFTAARSARLVGQARPEARLRRPVAYRATPESSRPSPGRTLPAGFPGSARFS